MDKTQKSAVMREKAPSDANLRLEKYEIKKPDYDYVDRDRASLSDQIACAPARYEKCAAEWRALSRTENAGKAAKLMFLGDITCFAKQFTEAQIGRSFDFNYEFEPLKGIFKQADLVVGNLETMIFPQAPYRSEKLASEQNYYCNAPVEFLDALRNAGIDALTNANNHDLDTGAVGIGETIDHIERLGFIQTGTFKTDKKHYELIDVNGFKVALIAFTTQHNGKLENLTADGAAFLLNTYSRKQAKKLIADAREDGAELVFVCIHWGVEHKLEQNDSQEQMAMELAQMGCDCIIGSHPHVLQPYTVLNANGRSVPVFYSMGNFVSHNADGPKSRSAIACVDLKRDGDSIGLECSYIPVHTSENYEGKRYVVLPIKEKSVDVKNKVDRLSWIKKVLGNEIKVNSDIEFDHCAEGPIAAPVSKTAKKLDISSLRDLSVTYDSGSFVYTVWKDHVRLDAVSEKGEAISFTVPDALLGLPITEIGEGAFAGRQKIGKINFKKNIVTISKRLCKNCISLEGVQLGSGVREIESEAFANCVKLSSAVLKGGVEKVGEKAFANCINLRSVKVGANVSEIADDAFEGCGKAVFYCAEGSYAEQYATEHGIPVKYMPYAAVSGKTVSPVPASAKKPVSEKKAVALVTKLSEKEILKAKKEAKIRKKLADNLDKIVAATGWDKAYAEERFWEAHENTQCTPLEYYMYRFYERTPEEQKTFYLACYQKVLQSKFGGEKEFIDILYDKEKTNIYFSEYVRRPWCANNKVTFEEFKEIFKDTKRVIYKPSGGHSGYGIEAYYLTPDTIREVYDKLASYPHGVVEQYIIQHPEMSRLSPNSVNSLRFVTISSNTKPVCNIDDRKVDVAYAAVRIGQGDSIVDNTHSGGMVANVDMETGTLETAGADLKGRLFDVHPETGTPIKGFKIPFFKEAYDMVMEAIEKKNVEGYLGWDIGIGVDGPMLIELNDRPGANALQTAYAQEGKGVKYMMEKYLDEKVEKPEPVVKEKPATPIAKAKKALGDVEKKLSEKEAQKARKEAIYKKKMEYNLDRVVAATGWDKKYAEEKFLEAQQRTQCTPLEFFMYRFYERTPEEQKTFYLACYQKILQAKYGTNKAFIKMLYDKERTNEYFSEYVRRPWCVNTKVSFEEFKDIFKDSKRIMYKPNDGHRGYGIEAFYIDADNIREVYDKLVTYPYGVVEEFIVQHPEMSKLSPSSVNSLRFVTISSKKPVSDDGEKVAVVYSMVRIGRGSSIVDNLHSGGMVSNVDMATGTLETHGADRNGKLFYTHPETGVTIKGFKIPYFDEAREMVKEAIRKNKVEGYLGWDIAISETGPKLLEVNDRPGSDGLQTAYAQEGKGVKYMMEKYL